MRAGDVLPGDIEVLGVAGTGGMGQVFRGRVRGTNAPVAIKLASSTADALGERLDREADVLARLEHPGIVRLLARGASADGRPYLVQDWIEGPTLEERLVHGRFPLAAVLRLGRALAIALGHAHDRGVIHRDVKPGNVILPGGDPEAAVLIDFGVACRAELSTTRTGAAIGTPAYMAPEQARGARDVDARADVFSLGCVLFECATGRRPFEGDNVIAVLGKICFEDAPPPSSVAAGIPRSLDVLLARLLAREPQRRPRDGTAVVSELSLALAHADVEPAAPTQPSSVVGQGEQRFVCVLAVGSDGGEGTPAADSTERMRDTIARHGGQTVEMADGSLLALFAPADRIVFEPAARVVRCALELAAAVPGRAIAVTAGRAQSDPRRLVGPAVDRASAMLGEAGARRGVRIDATLAGMLDERFDVRGDPAGLLVLGLRAPGEASLVCGRSVPFVGRDRELRFLAELAAECFDESRAAGAIVIGEPGMGKTRLLSELAGRLSGGGARVSCARGDALSQSAPFGVAGQIVAELVLARDGESAGVRRKKLVARIGGAEPSRDALRTAAFLGEVLGSPFDDEMHEELAAARRDPSKMSDQVLCAWLDLLSTETEERPHVLIVDDMQWCDPPSARLLEAALRVLAGRRLFSLLLARTGGMDAFVALGRDPRLHRVVLGPLAREGARQLAAAACADAASTVDVESMVERAQGNPFFLEELLRTRTAGGSSELPESILATVALRFDGLPPAARRAVRAATVFGMRFWTEGVAMLLGEAPASVRERLAMLREREIVAKNLVSRFPDTEEWSFRHALLRDAAYAMLPDEDRRRGHRLAGAWLERVAAHDPAALAHHFEQGGPDDRAVHWLTRAAVQGLEANEFGAVIDCCDRARRRGADGESLGVLMQLEAEARRFLGEIDLAASAADGARELLGRGTRSWISATTTAVRAHVTLDHPEIAERLSRDLLDAPGDSAELRAALALVAHVLMLRGKGDLARQLLARAEALGTSEPSVAAGVHRARTTEAKIAGRLGEMLSHCRAAVIAFDRAGDLRMAASQRINLGDSLKEVGAYEEAERVFREAYEMSVRLGIGPYAAFARVNLGFVLASLDRLEEGIRETSLGLEAYLGSGGEPRGVGGARVYLAIMLMRAGAWSDARRHIEEAERVLARIPTLLPLALAVDVRLCLAENDTSGAIEIAARLGSLMEEHSIEEGEVLAGVALVEASIAAGDLTPARARALAVARDVRERASTLDDGALRHAFSTRVPHHARILELAAELD